VTSEQQFDVTEDAASFSWCPLFSFFPYKGSRDPALWSHSQCAVVTDNKVSSAEVQTTGYLLSRLFFTLKNGIKYVMISKKALCLC